MSFVLVSFFVTADFYGKKNLRLDFVFVYVFSRFPVTVT